AAGVAPQGVEDRAVAAGDQAEVGLLRQRVHLLDLPGGVAVLLVLLGLRDELPAVGLRGVGDLRDRVRRVAGMVRGYEDRGLHISTPLRARSTSTAPSPRSHRMKVSRFP